MWVKVLVCLLSHLLTAMSLTFNLQVKCYDTGNFTTNSTYGKNRDLILNSLPDNVSASGGFFNATIGRDSNKVYALGMCRGDSTSYVCYSCINSAIPALIAQCPNQKEAISWAGDPPCIVHYADRHFFGILELEPTGAGYNTSDMTSNLAQFEAALSLIDSMARKASTGSSMLKYATGEADFTAIHKNIYALMQCTPDLSQQDCNSCLRESVHTYGKCCYGKQGGYVQKPNCWFRWELYPFYVSNPATAITAPSLSPTAPAENYIISNCKHFSELSGMRAFFSQTLPIIVVPTVIFLTVAVLFKRRKQTKQDDKKERKQSKSIWIPLGASLSATLGLALFSACGFFIWRRRNTQEDKEDSQEILFEMGRVPNEHSSKNFSLENVARSKGFPSFKLDILHAATNHFCDENKLGKGGFGPVYKGTLADGKEIAVKRLSKTSGQGLLEFKNEVMLIARLQHRNLVRLLGCCLEKNEKLLVYEFMPNRSLDMFLFDSSLAAQLDWQKRFNIIKGTARGIMYLHEDSRLRIIHRDLKASNVLLDHEMNPKISDFGMAKFFCGDQNEANTNRVVGTYGYMAPEYAMEGVFSIKSDVFSFGVLLLEIISGKRNNGFHLSEHGESLLTFAWKLWSKGQGMELIDQLLVQSCVATEVLKCIHIGLLCVQADPADRPTMSSVVVMLASDIIPLPLPAEPAFYIGRVVAEPTQPITNDRIFSANEVTITNLSPRD